MDVRPGGSWRFVARSTNGAETAFGGNYREVIPPERIVQTFESGWTPGRFHVETFTFEDLGDQTGLRVSLLFDTAEERDGVLVSGAERGMNVTYARLDELLAGLDSNQKQEVTMSLEISAVTFGVSDINRAKRFYGEGLGCPIDQDHPAFVSFKLGDGSGVLGLYTWDALAADAGVSADASSGFRGVVLSYIVSADKRVDEVLALAKNAGGEIVKPARKEPYGGYAGHFSDPDGHVWKVVSTAGYGT